MVLEGGNKPSGHMQLYIVGPIRKGLKKIWQYITVINTAASSYLWENVYNYDITFRHLMAFNPQRSWAVTYNQMWNLSMRDPIPRNFGKNAGYYSGNYFAPRNVGGNNGGSGYNYNNQ